MLHRRRAICYKSGGTPLQVVVNENSKPSQFARSALTEHKMSQVKFNEYRPGYVNSANGLTRVTKGQVWRVPGGSDIRVMVAGIEDGAVFIRPEDDAAFRSVFTRQETNKNGTLVDVLAFKEMGSGFKKGSPDEWKNGTFAAHEAWDVWQRMALLP